VFNLQGSELIIILLLALVVLGPEKLPDAMRKMGQFYGELKKMSSGFQAEFRAVVDEPLKELKDTANTLRDSADFTKLQSGERTEKPKSAEMLTAPDPEVEPTADLPSGEQASESSPIRESGPVPSGDAPSDEPPVEGPAE
jgi:sec-independent protein translocase protein TatB